MVEVSGESTPLALPPHNQIAFAEAVLGTPLFLPGAHPLPDRPGQREGTERDIRLWAIESTLRMARDTGKVIGELRSSTDRAERFIERVRGNFSKDIQLIGRHIIIANRFAQAPDWDTLQPEGADAPTTPRAQRQAQALQTIIDFLQRVRLPASSEETVSIEEICRRSLALISSTASGKTVMEALMFKVLGVGTQPRRPGDTRPTRGLLIVANQAIMEQYMGFIGDDTFRHFLGHTMLGDYWQNSKRRDAPMQLVLKDSLLEAISHGLIDLDDFEIKAFDEGHHGTEPLMMQLLSASQMPTFYFTATPGKGTIRDLRLYSQSVEFGSLKQDVLDGVVSPVQLNSFLYQADPLPQVAQQAVRYAQQGRRVFVYCQRKKEGDPDRQSIMIAELMNRLAGTEIAKVVGSHDRKSRRELRTFFNPDSPIRILATVSSLREGVNGSVDDVIAIGFHNLKNLTQAIGRAMRPGRRIATVSQHTQWPPPKDVSATIWHCFEMDTIPEPGFVLAAPGTRILAGTSPTDQLLPPPESADKHTTNRPLNPSPLLSPPELPAEIQAFIASGRAVRSILVAPRPESLLPPDNHTPGIQVAQQFNVPVQWLYSQLDKYPLPYQGVRTPDGEGGATYDRWYETDLLNAHLAKHSLAEMAEGETLTLSQIAALIGVHSGRAERAMAALKISDRLKTIIPTDLTPRKRYTLAEARDCCDYVEARTPLADPTDVPLTVALDHVGDDKSFARRHVREHPERFSRKRYPLDARQSLPRHGRDSGTFMSAESYQAFLAEWEIEKQRQKAVGGTGKTIEEIAAAAGVDPTTAHRATTAEERRRAYPKPTRGSVPKPIFPEDVARAIVRRLRPQLPPHLVSLQIAQQRTGKSGSLIRHFLSDGHFPTTEVNLGSRQKARAHDWNVERILEERWPPVAGEPIINYDKLAQPNETDVEKLLYSRGLQMRYVDDALLPTYIPLPIVSRYPDATPEAEPIHLGPEVTPSPKHQPAVQPAPTDRETPGAEIEGSVAGILIKHRTTRLREIPGNREAMPPKRPASDPTAGRINLLAYLEDQGYPCAPNIVLKIARKQGCQQPVTHEKRLWARQGDADTIALAVADFPVASKGWTSIDMLALEFSTPRLQLEPHHIHARAVALLSDMSLSLDQLAAEYRSRNQDNSIGILTIHYNERLTKLLRDDVQRLKRTGNFNMRTILGRGSAYLPRR